MSIHDLSPSPADRAGHPATPAAPRTTDPHDPRPASLARVPDGLRVRSVMSPDPDWWATKGRCGPEADLPTRGRAGGAARRHRHSRLERQLHHHRPQHSREGSNHTAKEANTERAARLHLQASPSPATATPRRQRATPARPTLRRDLWCRLDRRGRRRQPARPQSRRVPDAPLPLPARQPPRHPHHTPCDTHQEGTWGRSQPARTATCAPPGTAWTGTTPP